MFKHLYNIHTIVKNRYQFYIYNFYYTNQSITDNFEIKLNYTLSVCLELIIFTKSPVKITL